MENDTVRLITLKEACKILHITYVTLLRKVQTGKVPATKVFGKWLINYEYIAATSRLENFEQIESIWRPIDEDARSGNELLLYIPGYLDSGLSVLNIDCGKFDKEKDFFISAGGDRVSPSHYIILLPPK